MKAPDASMGRPLSVLEHGIPAYFFGQRLLLSGPFAEKCAGRSDNSQSSAVRPEPHAFTSIFQLVPSWACTIPTSLPVLGKSSHAFSLLAVSLNFWASLDTSTPPWIQSYHILTVTLSVCWPCGSELQNSRTGFSLSLSTLCAALGIYVGMNLAH